MQAATMTSSDNGTQMPVKNCLIGGGVLSLLVYLAIAWLSTQFAYGIPGSERPLLWVFTLFAAAFFIYVWQVRQICRYRGTKSLVPVIVLFGAIFRLLLLFSEPIQEVDAYRYLWDGQVVAAGVNPWRIAPQDVVDDSPNVAASSALEKLVAVRDRTPAMLQILQRVHFGELTTVYPPVSQAVFAVGAILTPDSCDIRVHLIVMKFLMVAFDLSTLWILIRLLCFVGARAELAIAYAWCPLVLKEFANSGHLDAIAVFLTVAAAYCAVRALFPDGDHRDPATSEESVRSWSPRRWIMLTSVMVSLAVGAKVYPLILGPMLVLSVWRRIGWRDAVVASVGCAVCTVAMILPMVARYGKVTSGRVDGDVVVKTRDLPTEPQLPGLATSAEGSVSQLANESSLSYESREAGLQAFAGRWQMNDFLFLILFENLRFRVPARAENRSEIVAQTGAIDTVPVEPFMPGEPASGTQPTDDSRQRASKTPWFAFTPDAWRTQLASTVESATGIRAARAPFLLTRLITSGVFLIVACWLGWRGAGESTPTQWLRVVFLTMAWFWLLLPTQNPWYWTWAVPFLPFARSRAWLAVSGLTFIYYFRFWFQYHAPTTPVFGTLYAGPEFFDFVVSWIEFCPWFIWLTIEAFLSRRSARQKAFPRIIASRQRSMMPRDTE
jgi:hypothetical protein